MARRRRSRTRTVPQFLKWSRRQPWYITLALVAAVALLVLIDRGDVLDLDLGLGGGDLARYDDQSFRVARVVDGDTLDLAVPDGDSPTTRVRLWGIDTPEVARAGQRGEAYSARATELARDVAQGQMVSLDLEPHRLRGRYGRLLAYVELPDGSVLNERLLLEGLATADDRWPHRHLERYRLLELQAKRQRRGLWRR